MLEFHQDSRLRGNDVVGTKFGLGKGSLKTIFPFSGCLFAA